MKILHICNDFSYSKVHANLYKSIDTIGFTQIIYHPLRSENNIGKNKFEFNQKDSKVIYSNILKKYHRLFFRKKITYLYNDLQNKIDLANVDYQYATTLFSDGTLALINYKEHNIPYIVAVRSTDVNLFIKLRPDLFSLGKEILLNAQKIIFIGPRLKDILFNNYSFRKLESSLKSKILFIPNGIDSYWLKEKTTTIYKKKMNNFLFIGRFDKEKNILRVIDALSKCRLRFPDIRLSLVGGVGSLHQKVINLIKDKEWITYYGYIDDKVKLKKIFNNNDFFIMPSIHETFGLVYLEALSQGLPILYTKGQGVDGIFEDKIGVSTFPKNTVRISSDIMWMMENREMLKQNIAKIDFSRFSWDYISTIYKQIFNSENIFKDTDYESWNNPE